jgi:hypothetical protein
MTTRYGRAWESIQKQKLPLIDIEESPFRMATRLATQGKDEAMDRPKVLAATLQSMPDHLWADFSRDTAGTETKLSGAGRRTAARLVLHGYPISSLLISGPRPSLRQERFIPFAGKRINKRWPEADYSGWIHP